MKSSYILLFLSLYPLITSNTYNTSRSPRLPRNQITWTLRYQVPEFWHGSWFWSDAGSSSEPVLPGSFLGNQVLYGSGSTENPAAKVGPRQNPREPEGKDGCEFPKTSPTCTKKTSVIRHFYWYDLLFEYKVINKIVVSDVPLIWVQFLLILTWNKYICVYTGLLSWYYFLHMQRIIVIDLRMYTAPDIFFLIFVNFTLLNWSDHISNYHCFSCLARYHKYMLLFLILINVFIRTGFLTSAPVEPFQFGY